MIKCRQYCRVFALFQFVRQLGSCLQVFSTGLIKKSQVNQEVPGHWLFGNLVTCSTEFCVQFYLWQLWYFAFRAKIHELGMYSLTLVGDNNRW